VDVALPLVDVVPPAHVLLRDVVGFVVTVLVEFPPAPRELVVVVVVVPPPAPPAPVPPLPPVPVPAMEGGRVALPPPPLA